MKEVNGMLMAPGKWPGSVSVRVRQRSDNSVFKKINKKIIIVPLLDSLMHFLGLINHHGDGSTVIHLNHLNQLSSLYLWM